jgi:hypothetical protein
MNALGVLQFHSVCVYLPGICFVHIAIHPLAPPVLASPSADHPQAPGTNSSFVAAPCAPQPSPWALNSGRTPPSIRQQQRQLFVATRTLRAPSCCSSGVQRVYNPDPPRGRPSSRTLSRAMRRQCDPRRVYPPVVGVKRVEFPRVAPNLKLVTTGSHMSPRREDIIQRGDDRHKIPQTDQKTTAKGRQVIPPGTGRARIPG